MSPPVEAATSEVPNPSLQRTGCILAGGLGTRLRTCMSNRPKALAEVAGRPFLDYLLNQFKRAGITRCILCVGYLGEQIERNYGESYNGMHLLYSREDSPLGTGGALRNARPLMGDSLVLVGNGDSFFDVDIRGVLASFLRSGKEAAILLRVVEDSSRYGRVLTDASGAVTAFLEKQACPGPAAINAGLYLLPAQMIEEIQPGCPCSLEHEIFPALAHARRLQGLVESGSFIDIGLPETYRQAQNLVQHFKHASD